MPSIATRIRKLSRPSTRALNVVGPAHQQRARGDGNQSPAGTEISPLALAIITPRSTVCWSPLLAGFQRLRGSPSRPIQAIAANPAEEGGADARRR